jgi:hypothetical protein
MGQRFHFGVKICVLIIDAQVLLSKVQIAPLSNGDQKLSDATVNAQTYF